MTSQIKQAENKNLGFIEKFAVPYYFSVLLYIITGLILAYVQRPIYCLLLSVITPFLGKLLPKDDYPIANFKYHNKNIYHALPLAACVIANWIFLFFLCIYYPALNYTFAEKTQFVIALALLLGPAIDASHQLIHRPEKIFQAIGFLNMTVYLFNVYPTEHVYLHHKYVGTTKDPITSPKNRNYYFYTIKAYLSAHIFVFKFSKKIFFGCISLNFLYLFAIFQQGLNQYNDIGLALEKLSIFILIGLTTFSILQGIEYIEHYGLIFRQDIDKKVITEQSSWNTDLNIIHNWIVFRFQRHSDHHMNAYKYFTTLQLTKSMPKFPFSFFEGMIISLCPPLWYYVMNPYVDEVLQQKKVETSHRQNVEIIRNSVVFILVLLMTLSFYKTQMNSN